MTKTFAVALDVPLGIRRGTMIFNIDGDLISGELNILGHCETFTGCVIEDDESDSGLIINIHGTLSTPIRSILYEGNGSMEGDRLHLLLQTKNKSYWLHGEAAGQKI